MMLTLAAMVPTVAAAQAWFVQSGVAGRGEFNDNYFFTATDKQSAFTASVAPFVTAARRTEASDLTALLTVGLNRVWGPSPTTNYVSGRLDLNGAVYDERSAWAGAITFLRAPLLQSAQTQAGVTLVRAYTNAASVNGGYSYALTERWSVNATAGWYQNDYDAVEGGASALSDNRGYIAGAGLDYRYTERTGFTGATVFSHYVSDITQSDAVTTTVGFVHEFSPQLTVSASVGGYWSDIETRQNAFVCPAAPILCDVGLVQQVLILSGERRRDSGALYGGGISYAASDSTRLSATFSQSLAPGSTGTLAISNDAAASLSHSFSERLTGRLGVGYTRTKFPAALSGSFANEYYLGEVGASFQLAERWILEAGYRYSRADYAENPAHPVSNLVFLSIGYNWPTGSFTNWVGARVGSDPRLGAGPISLPVRRPVPARTESPSGQPESSPFGTFTIP